MSKKTLSEPQIKFLRERLDFLMEKYDVEATNFLNIINEEWPELEDYDFDNVEVDIWMDDEADVINYTIEDMFRYLPNIDKLQYNECSAWCNNIKQFIIAVDEWEAERINITRFSLTSESLNLRFVENPFYIYNRENETSTILKRNEQIFSFFASFFSCSFDRLNIILTPIKSHSKRLKIGVSLCFLSCLLRHSGQTLQLHFRPKVRAFSLHCSRKCERFQGST